MISTPPPPSKILCSPLKWGQELFTFLRIKEISEEEGSEEQEEDVYSEDDSDTCSKDSLESGRHYIL